MNATHLVAPEHRYELDGAAWIDLRCPCGRRHRCGAETMLVTCACGDRLLIEAEARREDSRANRASS